MKTPIESLEHRRLLAWSAYAQVIGQDDAAGQYASLTGKGQTIAMIDTGIDYNHPSLGGGFGKGKKVIGGYDFYSNDSDPMDTDGHGTMTAGMAAANRFTSGGVTYQGIAPDASLVALRVGTGDDITDNRIEDGLQWVIANHEKYSIDVVNISLGGSAGRTASQLADEFAELADLGIFVVAASGNNGDSNSGYNTIAYPASDANVFSVGSIDGSDQISDFTQRSDELDLLAPGEAVTTTKRGGGFTSVDGTSFSSPLVAGAVAVLRQAASSLGVDDIASVLRASSETEFDGDGDGGRQTNRAYARLDLVDAIALAQSRAGNSKLDALAASKSTTVDSAYDQSGILHLAYYDASAKTVQYATRQSNGKWSKPTPIDRTKADLGQQLSIAIDQTGKAAIAYFDATNANLKYAWLNDNRWSNTTIEAKNSTGQYPSLVFDDENNANVAYYKKSGGDLKLATFDRAAGDWTTSVLDSTGDVGAYASLDYHVGNGSYTLAVAYADKTNGDLKYTRYNSDPTFGGWYTSVVDNLSGVANVSLALDAGRARIAYQDTKNADVKYAYRDDTWFTRVVASSGKAGQNVQSYVDDRNNFHVVYYDSTKAGTYDASVGALSNEVTSTTRVGSAGQTASVAVGDDVVTLVGLNKAGKSIDASDLV